MAAFNEPEWQVRAASPQCTACSRLFEHGETLTSRLTMEPEVGYRRSDLCAECASNAPGEAMSAWRTVYHKPPPVEEPLKKETAESLLRRLIEDKDEARLPAIFVLAVMLERKRILVERDVQLLDDGQRRRIYEHRGTGETFVIVDPRLRLDDLEKVQADVVALLGGGPETPADPAAPGEAPPPSPTDNSAPTEPT